MKRVITSERFLSRSPLFSAVLFYSSNLGLLLEMWSRHSAAGHTIGAWTAAVVSQTLWVNYYRRRTPGEFWANVTAWAGLGFMLLMLGSVYYLSR